MSDYSRTTLAFSIIPKPVEVVVSALADFFERDGDSPLLYDTSSSPPEKAFFGPIEDTPEKYQQPEWADADEPPPEDNPSLVKLAARYRNFAIDSTFDFAGSGYQGSLFVYDAASQSDHPETPRCFVRLGFISYLTYELRGTRNFGEPAEIDGEIKASLLATAVGLAHVLGADGFVYGLEGEGPSPFSADQLAAYLHDPIGQPAPVPPFFAGIRSTLVSRDDLLRVFPDEEAVKQASMGFVILDLLRNPEKREIVP